MLLAIATDVVELAVLESEDTSHAEDWLKTIDLNHLDTEQRDSGRDFLRKYTFLLDGSDRILVR